MNMQGTSGFVVETSGLTKRFGERVAVDNVELRVPRGAAFGYLGPNGAGKTTLIRMLLGLTKATGGTMRMLGRSVPDELLSHISPGHSDNINFFGVINVDIEAKLAKLSGGWRPLRPAQLRDLGL